MPKRAKKIMARDTGMSLTQVVKEAKGRVVKKLSVVADASYNYVSVEFRDGYEVWINFYPAVEFKTQWVDTRTGDAKHLREYKPIVSLTSIEK